MPQIITNTAELSCNQGTATSKLNVTSQDFVTIEGKAMATEEDKQANINLYTPNNICMNADKNFDLSVGNNLNFTIGGQATMQILQQMLLETPLMKQIVANYEARLGNALTT